MSRQLILASDHAATAMKAALGTWLTGLGHDVTDLGPYDGSSVDYPDYGYALAAAVAAAPGSLGIALCGSGIGISIAVNRHLGMRCARVDDPLSAQLARAHNDANVIALGARLIGLDMAQACITAFLTTEFAGDRHARRVAKLSAPAFVKEPSS